MNDTNQNQPPVEPVLQDAELKDERDLGEQAEKPPKPKELTEILLNDWQIAEEMRVKAVELGIVSDDENDSFAIDESHPKARELRLRLDEIQHALKQNPDAEERGQLEESLSSLYIEFAYNTTLLLKRNFHQKLSQLVSEARQAETNKESSSKQVDRVDQLIALIRDSGQLLIQLDTFKDDTANIFQRIDIVDTENALHRQLFETNIILYRQLQKDEEDLPGLAHSQASVLPQEMEKLTDLDPDQVAELLETLDNYRRTLIEKQSPQSTHTQEPTQEADVANVQEQVEEVFEIDTTAQSTGKQWEFPSDSGEQSGLQQRSTNKAA